MCAQMLPPQQRSDRPHPDPLTTAARGARQESSSRRPPTTSQRDQRLRWSWGLSVANLIVASVTVLLWHGSPLVLGLGAIVVAELLLLAIVYAVARRSGR